MGREKITANIALFAPLVYWFHTGATRAGARTGRGGRGARGETSPGGGAGGHTHPLAAGSSIVPISLTSISESRKFNKVSMRHVVALSFVVIVTSIYVHYWES